MRAPVWTPNVVGYQMAELLHGMQSGFDLPALFGFVHCAPCCNAGAHNHRLFLQAGSCSYFLVPSFQMMSSFYANRRGTVRICTVGMFMPT